MTDARESAPRADHLLAATLASAAGDMLNDLQEELFSGRRRASWGWPGDEGDAVGHRYLVDQLGEERPDDGLLSEEGRDNRERLEHERVWIVDPLDGSSGFGHGGGEWAVHVGFVQDCEGTAGAVAIPSMGAVFSTHLTPSVPEREDRRPIVVAGRSRVHTDGRRVAEALDADLATCSSAGVKAMLVVLGEVDVYVHGGPLYEWDVCAPAVVAAAAGLHVSGADGSHLVYNQRRPVVPGFVVCRPEFADATLDALR